MTFGTGHVAFAGTSSHFGVVTFPTFDKQTLLYINVTTFLLTPVGDLNRQRSSFNLHSLCILHSFFFLFWKETLYHKKMACSSSSSSSNSPKNGPTLFANASNTNNAPPPSPKMVPLPPSQPFPIFPLRPQVFLPHEVQSWEGSEEGEKVDSKELGLKAEEDVEDKAYGAFMRASSRCRRRRRLSRRALTQALLLQVSLIMILRSQSLLITPALEMAKVRRRRRKRTWL